MGEAKSRRQALAMRDVAEQSLSLDRRRLRAAARHLHAVYVRPLRRVGGCYYFSLALHEHLASAYGLIVPVQVGFVRPDGFAWASHAWLEAEERITDIAIHYPNPPVPAGDLLVDGALEARGSASMLYTLEPNDGVATVIESSIAPQDRARRIAEHARVQALAGGTLDDIRAYLAGAPGETHADLLKCWSSAPRID